MTQDNNKQSLFFRILGIAAILFGLATLRSGGSTLFIDGAIREASGNYVPFVVWSNFLMGFLYILAGFGIWRNRNWSKALSTTIVTITLLTFIVFSIHIFMDGIFEVKTVKAMTVRSLFWIFIAIALTVKKRKSKAGKNGQLQITKDTLVSDILEEYGDIEDVMIAFGIKSIGKYSIRKVITKFLTVERAAAIHKVQLDKFLNTLNEAVKLKKENTSYQ